MRNKEAMANDYYKESKHYETIELIMFTPTITIQKTNILCFLYLL